MELQDNPAERVPLSLCNIIILCLTAYTVLPTLYNLSPFHPLSQTRGPLLGRASLLWRAWHSSRGKLHEHIAAAHARYGPVVRVSPNELSFASVDSWRAIYAHAPPPHGRVAPKSGLYDVFGAGFARKCVGTERDPSRHAQMRKVLNPGFAPRALLRQEATVQRLVDQCMEAFGRRGTEPGGLDVTKWFELLSFDILGEMAFGESFGGVTSGKSHFWMELMLDHVQLVTLVDNLRRVGFVAALGRWLLPSSLIVRNKMSQHARNQVGKILSAEAQRPNFVSLLAQKVRDGEIDEEEMAAHVSTYAVAGSETTATVLPSVVFFLLKNPDSMRELTHEIRTAFSSYNAITASAVTQLPYLGAVISETMRIFPPTPGGTPRISLGQEVAGRWIPAGVEMYTSPWTMSHDPAHFRTPWEFCPERWLTSDARDILEASQPFLLGPRGCIGRNFANMEMTLVLAKMLWSFDLELVSTETDWINDGMAYILWRKPQLFVHFTLREAHRQT